MGFLKGGKEGIITRIVELIRPPVHEAGDGIKKKISTRLPGQVRDKLINNQSQLIELLLHLPCFPIIELKYKSMKMINKLN